jgi:hypothetical protein
LEVAVKSIDSVAMIFAQITQHLLSPAYAEGILHILAFITAIITVFLGMDRFGRHAGIYKSEDCLKCRQQREQLEHTVITFFAPTTLETIESDIKRYFLIAKENSENYRLSHLALIITVFMSEKKKKNEGKIAKIDFKALKSFCIKNIGSHEFTKGEKLNSRSQYITRRNKQNHDSFELALFIFTFFIFIFTSIIVTYSHKIFFVVFYVALISCILSMYCVFKNAYLSHNVDETTQFIDKTTALIKILQDGEISGDEKNLKTAREYMLAHSSRK